MPYVVSVREVCLGSSERKSTIARGDDVTGPTASACVVVDDEGQHTTEWSPEIHNHASSELVGRLPARLPYDIPTPYLRVNLVSDPPVPLHRTPS